MATRSWSSDSRPSASKRFVRSTLIYNRRSLIRGAAMIVAAYVVFGYVLLPIRLQGISMEPTYRNGQINFANRLAYVRREPARGDVGAIRMGRPEGGDGKRG